MYTKYARISYTTIKPAHPLLVASGDRSTHTQVAKTSVFRRKNPLRSQVLFATFIKHLTDLVRGDRQHVVHVLPRHPERLVAGGPHSGAVREQADL